MEIEEIIELANPDGFSKLKEKITGLKATKEVAKFLKMYDPEGHKIMDTSVRRDKEIETDTGKSTSPVARLPIAMQKKIVKMSSAFLCANPIELSAQPKDKLQQDLIDLIKKTWSDNKLHYDTKTIAQKLMSETEVAELWYFEKAPEGYWSNSPNEGKKANFRLRMKILAPSLGDELFPVFNMNGDMIAFARAYTIKQAGKSIEHFDIYTSDTNYISEKIDNAYSVKTEVNMAKKIPVIYYSQDKPEWADVQLLIERLETLISNHADSNDYFGSPVVFVNGDIEGFAKKGEQGKVLIGKNGAKAEYLTWDQAPESVKLEYNNLRSLIYDMTDTPDISTEQMKNIGPLSGIALKMLFMGAHLKAADKEEGFGKAVQRRINFIKSAMAIINVEMEKATGVEIQPKFTYFLPNNDKEIMDLIVEGVQAGVLSKASGVAANPLVENAEAELELIRNDADTTPQM